MKPPHCQYLQSIDYNASATAAILRHGGEQGVRTKANSEQANAVSGRAALLIIKLVSWHRIGALEKLKE